MQTVTLDIWPPRDSPALAMQEGNEGLIELRFAMQLQRSGDGERWSLARLWTFEATWYPRRSKQGAEIITTDIDDREITAWFAEDAPQRYRDQLQQAADDQWLRDREGE